MDANRETNVDARRVPHRRAVAALAMVAATLAAMLASPSPAGATGEYWVTAIASQPSDFTNSNGASSNPRLSGDGRWIAFTSSSTNLVPNTATAVERVYVHDLWTDEVKLVSHNAAGAANTTPAFASAITLTGSHIVFATGAQLDAADTNAFQDVYIWTRATDAVELVSKGFNNAVTDGDSGKVGADVTASVSDDGRYVAFQSNATNLLSVADSNAKTDVFRRDRTGGSTAIASSAGAVAGNGNSFQPDLSPNGRYLVFATLANNFGGTDTNGGGDIWLRDFNSISPQRVNFGLDADPNGSALYPKVSEGGNIVAFESTGTDLVANDTNGQRDVFVRNLTSATTTRASVYHSTAAQLPLGGASASLSNNGTQVGFITQSPATSSDTNNARDAYVRSGTDVDLKSRRSDGFDTQQNADEISVNNDADTAFTTTGQTAATDTNNLTDVFVAQDLFIGTFTTVDVFVSTQLARFRGSATQEQIIEQRKLIRAGASPLHFIMKLTDEAAFSAKRAPLARLYWAYFKRRPDLGGFNFWLNKYKNGKRLVDISQEFAKSSEFKNTYGNTTASQFVTLVYQNVLERQPEAGGLTYWANKINTGTPRGQVMTNFSESSEGKRVIGPRSDSILVALGMYAKIPSQNLFDAMVADVQNGFPREIIPAYILGAPEYHATL